VQVTRVRIKTKALSQAVWKQIPAKYGLECFLTQEADGSLELRESFPRGRQIQGKVRDPQGNWWLLCEYGDQLFKVPYHVQNGIPADILWNWEAQHGITQIYI